MRPVSLVKIQLKVLCLYYIHLQRMFVICYNFPVSALHYATKELRYSSLKNDRDIVYVEHL